MRIPTTTPSARTRLIQASVSSFKRATQLGAKVVQLAAPDQFVIAYAPSRPKAVLVSLPGTASYADSAAANWIEHCKRNGLALVTVQWWDGVSVYLTPAEIQDVVLKALTFCRAESLPRVIHGHSRGATQLYPLMGRSGGDHLPAAGYLVECGSLEADWCPNPDAAGQRVALVAGRGDVLVPSTSMRESEATLRSLGATTTLLEVGVGSPLDHGALTREPTSVDAALSFLMA